MTGSREHERRGQERHADEGREGRDADDEQRDDTDDAERVGCDHPGRRVLRRVVRCGCLSPGAAHRPAHRSAFEAAHGTHHGDEQERRGDQPQGTRRPPLGGARGGQRKRKEQQDARQDDEHRHVPEVDGHGVRSDGADEGARGRAAGQPLEAGPGQREEGELRHGQEGQADGGRVQVGEHIGRVEAGCREAGERGEGTRRESPAVQPRHPLDVAVGQPEAELLREQPHERQVEQPEGLDVGGRPQHVDRHDARPQADERRRGGPSMRAHQQRDERRTAEVDGQEPERLADAEPGDAHDLGGHTGREQPHQADADGADEHDRRFRQPHGALAHVIGGALAGSLQAFPVPQRREASQDEEEGHDLDDPAGGGEPGLGVEGVLEDGPVGAEADAHHEGVQRHDEDQARGAHEVDRAVAAAGRCADS